MYSADFRIFRRPNSFWSHWLP